MKNVISATVIALFTLTAQAQTAPAASPAPPNTVAAPAAEAKEPTKQQNKMKTCNADAKTKELKGDERKAFMKDCLSSGKQEKQQDKMKTCNADAKAKELKGDERKKFMSTCLKG